MPVFEVYQNKRVLLTGTTGFLGKVLLEKMLYTLDCVDKIFVLIRAKKGSKLNERFKREILDSPCFDRLRDKHGMKFDQFMEQKVQPIQGDLLKEGLGLSSADLKMLSETCNIIMNCAASIDFNARLDDAININIKGTFRMMELAKKCHKLQCFTHVSTCYVNCNMRGRIKQEIYAANRDPDQQLKSLLSLPTNELISRTEEILEEYPNTYTFTKALCQRLLQKHRGDLPLCIIRPAIINASYQEPCQGWVDSPAAASAIFLYGGLGLIRQMLGNPNHIGDNIPCDIVVNFMIVATAFHSQKKNYIEVYNVGSSDRNPITWGQCRDIVNKFWNTNQSSIKLSKADVIIVMNPKDVKYERLKRRLPFVLYNKVSTFLGIKQHQKNSSKILKSLDKGYQVESIFRFFVLNEWIYESQKVNKLKQWMNSRENKEFLVDVADIDVKRMVMLANYGIQKYVLKQNTQTPVPSNANLLQDEVATSYFSDLNWALKSGGNIVKDRPLKDYKLKILRSPKVQEAIQNEYLGKADNNINEGLLRKKAEKEAEAIADEIFGEFKMPVLRFFAWALHKIFKSIYEKIYIDEEMLERLRKIDESGQMPIVLAPTQKSYLDFLIVSYIFFTYKLKLPKVASDEVLLRTTLIPFLLRSSGGFFFRREQYRKSKLYRAIFNEYIQTLLSQGHNLEFFLEGSRSRTGKILAPKFDILEIIVESVLTEKIPDVCLVPMTINYEKVLEGDTFPEQLLGQEKVAESLLRVLKAARLLKVNYGRVYVQFCEPIIMSEYIKSTTTSEFNPVKKREQRKQLVEKLGYHIVYKMTEKIVIMSTAVVSAVLLMNRKGITQDQLMSNVHWLSKEIILRGHRIGSINKNSPNIAVRNAITHLENIIQKTKKNVFELQISAAEEYKKLLMLSYYRNTLTHVFLPEAFIGFALISFGTQLAYKDGIPIQRLIEETFFISNILKNEYIHHKEIRTEADFWSTIKTMIDRKIFDEVKDEKGHRIVGDIRYDKIIHFYCSFMSPLVESYWSTIQYILTTRYDKINQNFQIALNKFQEYVQWHVESLYDEKVINHYEACSLETIKNSIKTFENMGLLTIKEGKQRKIEVIASEQRLSELEIHLRRFIQNIKPLTSSELLSKSIKYDLLNSKL